MTQFIVFVRLTVSLHFLPVVFFTVCLSACVCSLTLAMVAAGGALAELQSKLEAATKKQLMSEKQIVARVAEARRLGEELNALKQTYEQSEVF